MAHSQTVFGDLRFYKHATQRRRGTGGTTRRNFPRPILSPIGRLTGRRAPDWEARADAAAQAVTDNALAEQAKAKEMRQDVKAIEQRTREAMDTTDEKEHE